MLDLQAGELVRAPPGVAATRKRLGFGDQRLWTDA